jgi:hypothetical protein
VIHFNVRWNLALGFKRLQSKQMDLPNPQTAAARLKKISPLRPTLAIVLGSGFHHAQKSPLQRGDC